MSHLSKAILYAIISYGIAKEDERELYEYSIIILLEQVSVWVSLLCIACLVGVLWETIFYIVLFVPIRIYAGGYHARSFLWCYTVSVGAYLLCIILWFNLYISNNIMIISVLIASAVILKLSPMADPNKPMDMLEKIKFKKLVKTILLFELSVFFLCFWAKWLSLLYFSGFVFFHLALLLLAGHLLFRRE